MISVDTKKKELVGDFKNNAREWRPKGDPETVRMHDSLIKALGRAVPYGVDDLAANAGWVGVGIDHDTAAFAVNSIRRWWRELGQARYPHATRLVVTADGGGGNGSRVRLWKLELQAFANETGLTIRVHHLPPRHKQVEQDQTPSLRLHQPEPARQAARQLPDHRPAHRRHHHQDRAANAERVDPLLSRLAMRRQRNGLEITYGFALAEQDVGSRHSLGSHRISA